LLKYANVCQILELSIQSMPLCRLSVEEHYYRTADADQFQREAPLKVIILVYKLYPLLMVIIY